VLRVGALADSSLIARPLGHYRLINCASPEYLARHGTPQALADLASHRLVHYVLTLGARSSGFEYIDPAADGKSARACSWPMAGALTVNDSMSYLGGCLAGLGIIQVPESGVRPYLESGQLVEILADFRPAALPVTLVYPNRRQLPRRVQAFMTWLEDLMRERLR
jgi:DNA-binding transcriptional LysR family regulator